MTEALPNLDKITKYRGCIHFMAELISSLIKIFNVHWIRNSNINREYVNWSTADWRWLLKKLA